jgi:hypothetical protein
MLQVRRQPLTIIECLFEKTRSEAFDIRHGYDASSRLVIWITSWFMLILCSEKQTAKLLWTEELEMEVRSLYDEFKSLDEVPEGRQNAAVGAHHCAP